VHDVRHYDTGDAVADRDTPRRDRPGATGLLRWRCTMPFVHLHAIPTTRCWMGPCDIDQLMKTTVERKMPAVARPITGTVRRGQVHNAANAAGVHPVIGCEVYVSQQGHKTRSDTDRYNHMFCCARNQERVSQPHQLVSTGYLEGFYYKPRIDLDLLAEALEGAHRDVGVPARAHPGGLLAEKYEDGAEGGAHLRGRFREEQLFLEVQDHHLDQGPAAHAGAEPASQENGPSRWWPPTTRTTCAGKTRARTRSCCASRPARG